MKPWAVFVPVGPGEPSGIGTQDLLDGLRAFEPEAVSACDVFLVNDGQDRIADLSAASGFRSIHTLMNPAGELHPWDRMTAGGLAAVHAIMAADDYAFAIKFDTDALVVNPFVTRIVACFAESERAGVVGSYRVFPDGAARPGNESLGAMVDTANRRLPGLRWLREWHHDRMVWAARQFVASSGRRRAVIGRARRNGHRASQHVQGGSFAIGGATLAAWREAEWFPEPLDFTSSLVGDDVLTSLCAVAAGFELVDLNQPGDPFGVWYAAPTKSMSDLAAANYAIVHSIKQRPEFDESATRQWFRGRLAQLG